MPDFSVYDTVQELSAQIWAATRPEVCPNRHEAIEVLRSLSDTLGEGIENLINDIESGMANTAPEVPVYPGNYPTEQPGMESGGNTTPSEPVPVVDDSNTETVVDPAPVVDAPIVTENPVVPSEEVPDVQPGPEENSTPVADNGGDSVNSEDPGAAPAPTVVEPQWQGDTEPGPETPAGEGAGTEIPVSSEPEPAPVVLSEGDNLTPAFPEEPEPAVAEVSVTELVEAAQEGPPADEGTLPNN